MNEQMRSILQWLIAHLQYPVVAIFIGSFVSLFFALYQAWNKTKTATVSLSRGRARVSDALQVAAETPRAPMLVFPSQADAVRQARIAAIEGLALTSLQFPAAQPRHENAAAELTGQDIDEGESDAFQLAAIDELISPPGQSARKLNVNVRKSNGVTNDALCNLGF